MQIAGSKECERCGAGLERCESCGAVACPSCLGRAEQCPSCKQPFREPEDPVIGRGRKQALAVAVSVLGALVMLALLSGQLLVLPMWVLPFGLLFVQLFRGRGWARWALVVLTGLIGLAHVGAVTGIVSSGQPALFSGAVALMFGWSAFILALSPPLARYLRAQRLKSP